jgi:hypothetical protein
MTPSRSPLRCAPARPAGAGAVAQPDGTGQLAGCRFGCPGRRGVTMRLPGTGRGACWSAACARPRQDPSRRAPCLQVLILKESCDVRVVPLSHDSSRPPVLAYSAASMDSAVACPRVPPGEKLTFTWRIDNFLAFKDILETRKIFSKFFTVGGCELRIGVYESFDTLCIYLESESQASSDPQAGSFWVRYRIAAVSQRSPDKTEWKESSICTRAWNNSVLQFIKVPEMLNRCAARRGPPASLLRPAVRICLFAPCGALCAVRDVARGSAARCAASAASSSRTASCSPATSSSVSPGSSSATPS